MEVKYELHDLIRVAGRWNNPKRNYLLVNPLQAKHIPARPSDALLMMRSLGKLAAESVPGCRLVIGFAETATAIGAAAASVFGSGCAYYQTTREYVPGEYVAFSEDHSHAVDQKLSARGLGQAIADTGSVVFVDDELTTGRTLLHMIESMSSVFPELRRKRLAVACLVSRLSPENEQTLADAGVGVISLVHAGRMDPESIARSYAVRDPKTGPVPVRALPDIRYMARFGADPRLGTSYGELGTDCVNAAKTVFAAVAGRCRPGSRIRLLGTEECMYPALTAGAFLETAGYRVLCHATTRSPIGVCRSEGYPIFSSVSLPSLYDAGRTTYLYDLEPMDLSVIVTDAPAVPSSAGLSALQSALPETSVAVFLEREADPR